ncbi:hypothetical protein JOC78_000715 [Bacillus ectoiniformans]|nr:hypothetical protein [Bacillus ectoiniformans]MBM7647775.1 hypothetical protein [Bacillus ectoiniformans]
MYEDDYMYDYDRQFLFFQGPSNMGSFFPPFGPGPGNQPGPGGFPPPPPPFPPGGGGGGGQSGPPAGPPPSFTPQQGAQAFAVDPGAIRGCLYRYTYIWMRGNQQFWFYPVYVGRRSVAGYRWTGFNWVYFGVDLRRIQSFQCF